MILKIVTSNVNQFEHLNTIFPTTEKNEDGSSLSQEQVKQNTENKKRISTW